MYELEAMALPQPNVLNLTSLMMPLSSTRIWSFITSPQLDRNSCQDGGEKRKSKGTYAGAPTNPVPTSTSVLGREPTWNVENGISRLNG
jgi:hypothetical protein